MLKDKIERLKKLHEKSGLVLFILRLPLRVFIYANRKTNTFYWRLFLNKMGRNVLIEPGVKFENPKQVIIGNNVYIGKGSYFGSEVNNGSLIIKDNVHIGYYNKIDHTGTVVIEENTLTSASVQIFSHSHGYDPRSKPQPTSLIIKKNCWIGNNAIILEKAKTIEEGVIIGASSLVSSPCAINKAIYAGVPAKYIKEIK